MKNQHDQKKKEQKTALIKNKLVPMVQIASRMMIGIKIRSRFLKGKLLENCGRFTSERKRSADQKTVK